MANYNETWRTNYFRVRDLPAFRTALHDNGISTGGWDDPVDIVLDDGPDNEPTGAIALFSYDGAPFFDPDQCDDEAVADQSGDQGAASDLPVPEPDRYNSIHELIAAHLVDTDIAVTIASGHEKMRYIGGDAVAVDHTGHTVQVSLHDIYRLATQQFTNSNRPDPVVTLAEY